MVIQHQDIPLRVTEDKVIRVGDTRVTLDTVVSAFEEGATPEEIAAQYSSLALADIYAVVGYYLRHRDEINAYLHERQVRRDVLSAPLRAEQDKLDIRNRLLRRRPSGN